MEKDSQKEKAWTACDEAVAQAHAVYKKAVGQAEEDLCEATRKPRAAYSEAIAQARQALDEAADQARVERDQ